ncbi:MAG TPA: DUF2169 domain-containing protein [Polyangiaceae bacterium]
MKVVKPLVVSFLYRVFQLRGELRFSATGMVGFELGEGVRRLVADIHLWQAISAATEGIVDEGLPKPRSEVLVFGACHAPGGRPTPVSAVRVRVGPEQRDPRRTVDKKLAVFGDRSWRPGIFGDKPTDAVPFTMMPLGWARAFGGTKYAKNPLGRGIDPHEETGFVSLPNVEHPSSLIASSSQRPEPAGFGLLEMGWPQRRLKAGTYDARWLEADFPGFAGDIDPEFFGGAPQDQRIDGFFEGDEQYLIENMHPSRPLLEGTLPPVAARIFVRRCGERDIEEVRTRLETVVFLPNSAMGFLVFRGTTPVTEDDAADIEHVLAACEDPGDPRPASHYARALERRLDKDQDPKLALYEDDMVPPFAAGTNLLALGLSADAPGVAEAGRDQVLEEARAAVEQSGVPSPAAITEPLPAEQVAPGEQEPPPPKWGRGPPKLEAPLLLARLREASIESEADVEKRLQSLQEADARAIESYRTRAHVLRPARPLEETELARARAVIEGLRADGKFAERDLTRHDLSGLTFEGADFRKALLEGADLSEASLAGADLSGAVLAHAVLRSTALDGAVLEGANLGATTIEGSHFVGANLRKAIFARASLLSASLKDADLADIDWFGVVIGAVDFEGANLGAVSFLGHDLARCRFPRARLVKASFLKAKLDGVEFAGADLTSATLLTVSANGADFRGACLRKTSVVLGSSLQGANFQGADLTDAVLRGCNLRGAHFEGAKLDGANVSDCDLTGATMTDVQAKELVAIRANLTDAKLQGSNLMEAMLQKSTLQGTDLSRTNLFLANLSLTRTSDTTQVRGANLKRALMVPKVKGRKEP